MTTDVQAIRDAMAKQHSEDMDAADELANTWKAIAVILAVVCLIVGAAGGALVTAWGMAL